MHLPMLSNEELLRIASAEIDELTSTPLELELLHRFAALLDEQNDELVATADEFDIDHKALRQLGEALILDASNSAQLLSAIGEAGYDNVAALKADLDLAETFSSLACDAGDVFSRLSTLTETATA